MKKLKFTRTALKLIVASIALIFCGIAHAQYDTSDGTETSTGQGALSADRSSGDNNTANGYNALLKNTTGTSNTASGAYALDSNTSGESNTAAGDLALENNTNGVKNTAEGYGALAANINGSNNTASGVGALGYNTSGYLNTASGAYALFKNTSGTENTASGVEALEANTTGSNNTANGFFALFSNTTGAHNTAVGYQALIENTTGTYNIAIGDGAGNILTKGSYNIDIGAPGFYGDSKTIRLGKEGKQMAAFVAGVYGTTAASGVEVYIDSNGQLGTMTSSAKFKRNIHDMGSVSDALMALRPVTFQYKSDIDPTGTPQFGLIAEEVEKVNPDLVARDDNHNIYTVRYEAVNAMLLNEVQRQHRRADGQEQFIAAQEKTIAEQQTHAQTQDKTIADQQKLLQSLAARLDQVEQAQATKK